MVEAGDVIRTQGDFKKGQSFKGFRQELQSRFLFFI